MDTKLYVHEPAVDDVTKRHSSQGMRIINATDTTLTVETPIIREPSRTIFRSRADKQKLRRFRKRQKARGNR
jgi:3-methyladenine DNA glycosylase AlkC